jgi:hypothetical protein
MHTEHAVHMDAYRACQLLRHAFQILQYWVRRVSGAGHMPHVTSAEVYIMDAYRACPVGCIAYHLNVWIGRGG